MIGAAEFLQIFPWTICWIQQSCLKSDIDFKSNSQISAELIELIGFLAQVAIFEAISSNRLRRQFLCFNTVFYQRGA